MQFDEQVNYFYDVCQRDVIFVLLQLVEEDTDFGVDDVEVDFSVFAHGCLDVIDDVIELISEQFWADGDVFHCHSPFHHSIFPFLLLC